MIASTIGYISGGEETDWDSALMFFGGLALGAAIAWAMISLGELLRDLSKGS